MQVKVTHVAQVKFSIQAGHHTILSDQPVEAGGNDSGMTPPELLLASLGSCAAYYAVQYLKTRKREPARIDNFLIDVQSQVALTEEQKQGMLRSIHQCLIHNTMLSIPKINVVLNSTASKNPSDLSSS